MKCTCGVELKERFMKIGCLAFTGLYCPSCKKGYTEDGRDLGHDWDDLEPYGKGTYVGSFSPKDVEELAKKIFKP